MLLEHPEVSDDEIRAMTALAAVDAASAQSVPYKTVRLIPAVTVQNTISSVLQGVTDSLESGAHVIRGAVGSMDAVRQGLRRLAVAQVGSRNHLDEEAFADALARLAIETVVPVALRAAAATQPAGERRERLEWAAALCEQEPNAQNARAASDEADAAWKRERRGSAMAAGIAGFRAASAAGLTRVAFTAEWRAAKAASVLIEALRAVQSTARVAREDEWRESSRERMICGFLDGTVQILADLGAPGIELLWLADDRVVRNMADEAVHQAGLAMHEVLGQLVSAGERLLPRTSAALAQAREVSTFVEYAPLRESDLIEMASALAALAQDVRQIAGSDRAARALIDQASAVLEREVPAGTLARWIDEMHSEPITKVQGLMTELHRRGTGGERGWRDWRGVQDSQVHADELESEEVVGIER